MDFAFSELYLLHETVLFLDRIAEEEILPPFGLTYADSLLLIMIRHHPGSSQQELAGYLNLGKSSLSQRLAGLLARRLVAQKPRPENRRENSVDLSPLGLKLTLEFEEALSRAGDAVFRGARIDRAGWRDQLLAVRNYLAGKFKEG